MYVLPPTTLAVELSSTILNKTTPSLIFGAGELDASITLLSSVYPAGALVSSTVRVPSGNVGIPASK